MAHAFTPIPAKSAFGTLQENLYQSDYLNRKKGKLSYYRGPSYCNKNKNQNSYNNINSYKLGRYANNLKTSNVIPVHKWNLIVGQYTKMNLTNVCTISNSPPSTQPCDNIPCDPCQNNTSPGVKIQFLEPFYLTATIDQLGELFGNSQCGELNYNQYMVLYPQIPTVN